MGRVLESHQCVAGSIPPRPGIICGLSLLLVLQFDLDYRDCASTPCVLTLNLHLHLTHSELMSHKKTKNKKTKNIYLFRLQIAILHFNENSDREQATLQDGRERFNITFPKYKKGEHTVKKILVKCTYGE